MRGKAEHRENPARPERSCRTDRFGSADHPGNNGRTGRGGRLLPRAARLAVTLTAIAAVFLLVYFLPPFRVDTIDVTETRAMTRPEILQASGLTMGQHLFQGIGGSVPQLFGLRYGRAEATLADRFPAIRTVTARLDFPGRIEITIEERIEVSYLRIPDGCILVDKEGFALRILPAPPATIPVIEGITVRQLSIGKALTVDLPEAWNHALSVMGAIIDADKDTRSTVRIMPMVRKIRPVSGRDVYLTLILPKTGEDLTVLTRVTASVGEDITWLRFAILQGALDGRGKGVLDMTGENRVFIPDRT